MKSLLLIILISILYCGLVFPQHGVYRRNASLFLDYAKFRYDEKNTFLEVYYLLYYHPLDSSEAVKTAPLKFSLYDVTQELPLASEKIEVSFDEENTGETGLPVARGSLISSVLPPGEYRIEMLHLDETGGQTIDSVSHTLIAAPFKSNTITLSDLELCANIIPNSPNKSEVFYKNTMEVYPNPSCMFGSNNTQLYYYIELYNIRQFEEDSGVEIQVTIKDVAGNTHAQKNYTRNRGHESLVETGRFNVAEFTNGFYTLTFTAIDPVTRDSVSKVRNFYVVNRDQESFVGSSGALMRLFMQSGYFNMPEEAVDERFAQAQYIALKREIEQYVILTAVKAKRIFLFKFWQQRETGKPGLQDEYYERVQYANEEFDIAGKRQGWQSDRGRVHITYGKPDYIDRNPHSFDVSPYEIWYYYQMQGGVKFLFMDETGFGDYRLMSSTLKGEVFDPRWERFLLEN